MVCACIPVGLVVCRGRMFFSRHICFVLIVLIMLFRIILEMVRSAVPVVSSPGWFIRFPFAVVLTRLGAAFCRR